jgi:hypothetical protein
MLPFLCTKLLRRDDKYYYLRCILNALRSIPSYSDLLRNSSSYNFTIGFPVSFLFHLVCRDAEEE